MTFRWAIALVVALLVVAGPVAAQGELTLEALDARLTALEQRLATRTIATVEADGVLFQGEGGNVVSESFPLDAGSAIITAEMTGAGYQMMNLLPAPGSAGAGNELIVNGEGPFSGSTAVSVFAGGEFIIEVQSTGPWSVTVEQ